MSLKFGTSGLRGLAEDLKGRAAALYATAFVHHLCTSGRVQIGDTVLIGRDFRDSSPDIAANCAAALTAAGFAPVDCGALPTPALALYGLDRGAAALMVTGSHIPADRNGIKFYRPDGEIDKHDELSIAAIAANLEADGFALTEERQTARTDDGAAEALFFGRNVALLPAHALTGLRIGVYQHSTVARDLLVRILEHYGADVVALGRSEHFVPVDTEAVAPETVGSLKTWTHAHRLDAIVSADGDGDRPLISDEQGNPLRGDLLGLIAANFLGAQVVVTPVTSNSGIEANGTFATVRTQVGSPFVIAGMEKALVQGKTGVMGFEANGGLLTGSPFVTNGQELGALPTRDSVLPVLAALMAVVDTKRPLSGVASAYALPVAAADRLENYPAATSGALMALLRSSPGALSAFLEPIGMPFEVSDIDGLRVKLADGRIIHFRPSGNAPELRCYVEAKTEDSAKALLEQGLERMRRFAKEGV